MRPEGEDFVAALKSFRHRQKARGTQQQWERLAGEVVQPSELRLETQSAAAMRRRQEDFGVKEKEDKPFLRGFKDMKKIPEVSNTQAERSCVHWHFVWKSDQDLE
uniref:Uncharacterized protein n=1 Tax=Sphaerodactylus townsendi TaxID=933632 RepID=A0ACB8EAN3_9SAUR